MAAYIAELRAQGFTQLELDRMTKDNPARLLGLPVLCREKEWSWAPGEV